MKITVNSFGGGSLSILKAMGSILIGMAIGLFLLVRWAPEYIQTATGDDAFTYSFHYAFAHSVAYGSAFFHTAGPWSVLHYPHYYPETFWWMILGQLCFAGLLSWVLIFIARRFAPDGVTGCLFFLGSLALFVVSADSRFFFLSLCAVLFMPDFRIQRATPLHLTLIAFTALAFLVKGTFLLTSGVVFILTLFNEVVRARRFCLVSLALIIFLFLFNALAGQSPAGLISYVAATLDVSSGYPERFSELGSPIELIVFILIASLLWAMIWLAELAKHGRWGIAVALGYGAILFALFKTGFLRQDGQHLIRSFCAIIPFFAAYYFVNRTQLAHVSQRIGLWDLFPSFSSSRILASRPLVMAGIILCLVFLGFFSVKYPSLWIGKFDRLAVQARSFAGFISHGQRDFLLRHQEAMAKVRAEYSLPPLKGTVAVFSVLQTPAIAHSVDYRILPTAPYVATTPKSDGVNAQFFSGEHAPDFTLFKDVNYAATASGVAFLENYRPKDSTGPFLILERRSGCSAVRTPLVRLEGKWEQRFELPNSGGLPIWAEIIYGPTWLNQILGLVYQPSPAYLVLYRGVLEVQEIRINRRIVEAGIVVSPAIQNLTDFVALFPDNGMAKRISQPVTSVRLRAGEPGSWLFSPEVWSRYFKADIRINMFTLGFKCALR